MSGRRLVIAACAVPLLIFLAVYVPASGHGFLKDDFVWILNSRAHSAPDLLRVLKGDNGFYRPVVSLTFTANQWMFGTGPRGYGLTNVALALASALSIMALARALGLPWGAAVLAAMLWLLNIDGIRGSIGWISGRTYLILTLLATATATALVRGRFWTSLAVLLLALFAKEEAILLPLVLGVWLFVLKKPGHRMLFVRWAIGSGVCVAAYLVARSWTHAMTPLSAPVYYRPVVDVRILAHNALQYADWALTFSTVMLGVAWLALGRSRAVGQTQTRSLVLCGMVWLVGGFGLTLFVPSRSENYACLPSVGGCLIAASIVSEMWARATASQRQRALVLAVLLPLLLAPVYYLRSRRLVGQADLSTHALHDLQMLTAGVPEGATVIVDDDESAGAKNTRLTDAFGTLLDEGFLMASGRHLHFWIEPPPTDAAKAGLTPPCPTCASLHVTLVDGRLQLAR